MVAPRSAPRARFAAGAAAVAATAPPAGTHARSLASAPASQTTRVLKAGDTRHEAVIFYTKLEDEGERLAAEAAEQAARESLAAQWASLGRTVATAPGEAAPAGAGAPGRQSSPAAPRGEAPSEADVAAARRTLAASKHMPRAKWDQSGTWKVDKKAGDPPHGVLEALGVPCEPVD